ASKTIHSPGPSNQGTDEKSNESPSTGVSVTRRGAPPEGGTRKAWPSPVVYAKSFPFGVHPAEIPRPASGTASARRPDDPSAALSMVMPSGRTGTKTDRPSGAQTMIDEPQGLTTRSETRRI